MKWYMKSNSSSASGRYQISSEQQFRIREEGNALCLSGCYCCIHLRTIITILLFSLDSSLRTKRFSPRKKAEEWDLKPKVRSSHFLTCTPNMCTRKIKRIFVEFYKSKAPLSSWWKSNPWTKPEGENFFKPLCGKSIPNPVGCIPAVTLCMFCFKI